MRKKQFVIILLFIMLSAMNVFADSNNLEQGVSDLVAKLMPPTDAQKPKKSIAVLSFTREPKYATFDTLLQNLVFEDFFLTGRVILVERENIDKVLKEQNFQISGNVDDNTAKKIGNVIGVDYVCYGSIIELQTTIRLSGRIVDVQTGEIISLANIAVPIDETTEALLRPNSQGKQKLVSSVATNGAEITNYWKIETNRNEFGGYTAYLFTLNGAEDYFLFISFMKYDDPSRSIVSSGIGWNHKSPYEYEIKAEDQTITKTRFTDMGYKDANRTVAYQGTDTSRVFFSLILNNNKLVIRTTTRGTETVQTFTTYGLAQAIAAAGLKYADFDAAMENNEF